MNNKKGDGISRRDAAVACAACALFGSVLTAVVLTGSDIPLKCMEGGNIADWAAAFGTWVIGYGAWRIAKDSHQHRINEYEAAVAARNEERKARILRMRDAVANAAVLRPQLSAFSEKQADKRTRKSLKTLFEVARKVLSQITFSDADRAALPADGVGKLGRLEFSLMHNLDLIETVINSTLSKEAAALAVSREDLTPYIDAAKSLETAAEAVMTVLVPLSE
ncbi:hypothetical protein AAHH21_11860 [Stenotrophomonas sp. BSUC-16]|uniref:hypothetical protein n=1 Tax=Stenotrophomonas sp. BSUC-16 TaxID=3156074 RepID=UPI003399FA9C